jgi:hypothetical protein
MSKAVEIYKTVLTPVVVCRSESWPVTDGYEKTKYMGGANIEEDIWANGRIRNMENKE